MVDRYGFWSFTQWGRDRHKDGAPDGAPRYKVWPVRPKERGCFIANALCSTGGDVMGYPLQRPGLGLRLGFG